MFKSRFNPSPVVEAQLQSADQAISRKDYGTSINILNNLLNSRHSDNVRALALYFRGYSLKEIGDYRQALIDLEQAIKLAPQFEPILAAYYVAAQIYGTSNNLEAALDYINRLIKLAPNNFAAINYRGWLYARIGDQQQAIASYSKAISLNPNQYLYYFNRGMARFALEDYEGALSDFNSAVKVGSDDDDLYFERAKLLNYLGRPEQAMADINHAIALNSSASESHHMRAEIYVNLGQMHNALTSFSDAINLNPYDAQLYIRRCQTYMSVGDHKSALRDIDRAIALNSQNAFAYFVRGCIYQDIEGTYASNSLSKEGLQALGDFDSAIRINPRVTVIYGHRAQLYMKAGQLRKAFEDLKIAITENSNDWIEYMQLVVNGLADDGYNQVVMQPAFFVGMPEYNQEMKTIVRDWDHYLEWRLARKRLKK